MRKRMWAVLLTVCLLVGLLPTTALAGGEGMDATYATFEAFKAALEGGTNVSLSDCNFTWPATEETIQVNGNITVTGQREWEIPSNITLEFPTDGSAKIVCYNDFTLTIRGTVKNEDTSTRSSCRLLTLQTESKCEVVIADGGRVEGGFYIDDHETWTVENGGTLAANVMLGGTLQGTGGVVTGTVTVNNGYSSWGGENWTAHLSGNLTLGGLQLNYSNNSLIIPSGSQITLGDEASLDIPKGSQLSLEGGLTIGGGYGNSVAGTIDIGENGTLTIPQDSALFGEYAYNSETEELEEVYGQITGTGTIKAYATQNGNVINGVPCVWDNPVPEIVSDRAAYADLVAETVTIWCSWAHTWDEGVVTKEPTCTEPGEIVYTCTDDDSGETWTQELPATGHDYDENGVCTVCGASEADTETETCSITLHYDDTLCDIRVIDGNTQSSDNPTVFVTGNGQSASVPSGSWIIFEIFNIRDGYRIGSVTINSTDYTKSFVNGAYGSLGISNISTDYTLTADMEEIPETLPSVTSVTLYTDLAGTQPAAENITYTSESTDARLYGKATFSDGVEYPVYYAMGQWQFSTDGTTWQDTKCWGSNRFDFWPGWQYHEELDFLNASYDIRLKVNPQDLYTTGSSVYSNVIHINGGAVAAPTDPETPATDVVLYVNGVNMVNGGTVDGAVYTAATNTLTLNGAAITGYYTTAGTLDGEETDIRAGIYYKGEEALSILLADSSQNTITLHPSRSGDAEYGSYIAAVGIYADGSVEITASNFAQLMFENDTITEADAIFETKEETAYVCARAIHATDSLTISGGARVDASVGSFRLDPSVTLNGWVYNSAANVSAVNVYAGETMQVTGVYPQFYSNCVQVDGTLVMNSGIVNVATFQGGDVSLVKGNLTINSFTANDISMSGGTLTAKKITAHDLAVTGGALTTEASSSNTSLKGVIELTGDANISGGTVTAAGGIQSAYETGSFVSTTGSLFLSGDAEVTAHGYGVQFGGAVSVSGNAKLTVTDVTFSAIIGCQGITIADNAVVTAAGPFAGIQVGNYNATGVFRMTGGTLTATASSTDDGYPCNMALYVMSGSVEFSGGRAELVSDPGCGILFEAADDEELGDFSVTGGYLKVSGARGGVIWKGGSGLPVVTRNVTVKTNPAEIQYLDGALDYERTYNGTTYNYTAYAATYVGSGVTALDIDPDLNGSPTNGLTTIVFGAEPCENHDWGDWTVTKEATCTEAGVETRTCQVCGETETREIAALGHDYVAVVTDPTCTEQGYTTYTCSRCGDSYKDDYVNALSHNYVTVVTASTCTEQGYTTYTCSRCGDSYVDDYVDALGHDWGEWVVDKEATGTEDGSRHRDCSRCDAVDTEVISKLPKQNVSWTIEDTITWTYGSRTNVTNTADNKTVDGGALTYSSSDTGVATVDANGKAAIVGAGTATITATAAAVPGQYAATSASYTLVINKAPLTVTAKDAAITYGRVPANSGWTASGFAYDDDENDVTGTASYAYTYEQYSKVGTYAISVSGLTAKNYDITYAPGTLTVSKAADYTITLGNLAQRDDGITPVTTSIAPQDATAQIEAEYFVDGAWTTSLPTKAGEYQVRASLTASDNIQTDNAYTYGALTIERTIVVDNTDVSVTVEDGKAEIIVTADELADIVANADGDVSVNLGGVENVDELVLPGSLVEALSESGKADSLTIATEDASISMSGAVLDTVASAVADGEDTVAVKLTAVEEENLTDLQKEALNSITQSAVIVEVSLVITHTDGTTTELHELGGNVEVTVPFTGAVPEGKYIVVCYLSDDGSVTYVRATYDPVTQQVTFNTNHFSNYALFVSGDPAVIVDGGSGSGLYAVGETVTIKADSKSGYTFTGWEIVAGSVTLADAKAAETTFTMPAGTVELTATYTKNSSGGGGGSSTYTLTFDTNGGSKITSVSKTSGTTIDLTGYVPTRTGYDFDGWYANVTLTDKITSVKLTKNMTVYAKWVEKSGENPFTDVAGDTYYADAVTWAVGKGITSGTAATTFSPDAACTRAQAVTFLWRAAGSPAPKAGANPFADVKADAYYYDAVLWAVEQGITSGTSATTFSPNATCTRAQIVTFLWRAQKSPTADGVYSFTDVAGNAYYAGAVLWAVENGITAGTSATTFSPDSDCTRAQIVTFLYHCMK